jgi:UDPglucose 6-dehydrogenase
MRLSVVGLGKLGLPLATVFAAKGHNVVGIDVHEEAVSAINQGTAPTTEPGLQKLLSSAENLSATTHYPEAVRASDATFIVVPTPSETDGAFSLRYVLTAVEEIGKALRTKAGRHLVVIVSTVMPGSTSGPIRQTLELSAGRTLSDSLGLCYSPEFIALGSVIQDLLRPDFLLIGELDTWAGDMLESILSSIRESTPPVSRMSPINAELVKLSVNAYITTKISYANMLSEICDRSPGADVDTVTEAIGRDSRIGRRFLRAATGYGGPCFPRDNLALIRAAQLLGVEADIPAATDRINRRQLERLADLVLESCPQGSAVAVLGASYKPGTDVIEQSTGTGLAALLIDKGFEVRLYDRLAKRAAERLLGETVRYMDSVEECVKGAQAVVVTTASTEFATLPSALESEEGCPLVIDCWRLIDGAELSRVAKVAYLGVGDDAVFDSAGRDMTSAT